MESEWGVEMIYVDDEYIFQTTGRRLYANNGILGLGPEKEGGQVDEVSEGYDGGFEPWDPPLSPTERTELGYYMIARWKKWMKEEEK